MMNRKSVSWLMYLASHQALKKFGQRNLVFGAGRNNYPKNLIVGRFLLPRPLGRG